MPAQALLKRLLTPEMVIKGVILIFLSGGAWAKLGAVSDQASKTQASFDQYKTDHQRELETIRIDLAISKEKLSTIERRLNEIIILLSHQGSSSQPQFSQGKD